jgi:Peptidase family M23
MATPEELVRLTIAALFAVWSEWAASLPQHTDWQIGAAYVRESSAKSLEGIQPSVQLRAILYGHLQPALLVTEGKSVSAGEPIGSVGMTGNTTGPHLHLGIFVSGQPIDPRLVLPSGGRQGGSP